MAFETEPASAPPPHDSSYAPRPLPALVTAGVVAGYSLLVSLVSLVQLVAQGYATQLFSYLLLPIVPEAVGVFLLLWLLPVRTVDRLPAVLLKGAAAAFVGTLFSAVATIAVAMVSAGLTHLTDLQYATLPQLGGIVSSTLTAAPLVMLVVVVQWAIARRAQP